MKPIKPMKPISITRRHPPVSLSKQAVGCASSPQFQVPTCYCDIGQVAGRRITAGQGNTVPQDATQNSFFDFMADHGFFQNVEILKINYLTSLALIGGKLCPDRSTATDHPSPTTHLHPATMNLYTPPHAQMIQLTGAAKRFGPKTLFENLDWLVTSNERAGIVGANGTGKSTLLKILAGMDGLDAGTIVTMKGASIGYLPQEGLSLSGRTVFAEC